LLNQQEYANQLAEWYTSATVNLNWEGKLDITLAAVPRWQTATTPELNARSSSLNSTYFIEWWFAPLEKVWIDGKFTYRSQNFNSVASEPTRFSLWSMALTYLVLKENRGQLRLSAFDLLGQNQNTERISTSNELTYRYINAVTRYYMLSFVYNFNSFEQKGRQKRGFSFWY
ncbi:MAG: hypothetical protein LPK45_01880, partial [Bacteroidota bacterium]|nr:hypothetical protein [Bacteroidota bacterium]MDX5429783.1 hypothetical protein [Bacteroidota bacterium]MDX5468562.1 hypothetical protein [Bacteroidota bacterium]